MNKTRNNMLVPKLRFNEFKDSKEWQLKNGNEIFDQISDKNHNSDLPILAITQEQGAIPRNMINYNVSVTDKSIESYKVVEIGDFIISLRSFQGGIEYSKYKGLCSPAYIILRKKNTEVNEFFKHYFKTKKFIQDLNKNLEGIRDGKMVSYKQFSEIPLPYPKPDEQQKIADCLSSLDDVINAETQKLDALKDHKKGLMQQLFPGEGETVPKLRFEEFRGSGEWLELPLGKAAEIITGNTPPTNDTNNYGGERLFVSPADISTGRFITETKTKLSEKGYSLTRRIKENSVLFVCIGSTIGKVAQNKYQCATNQQINSLVPYEDYSSDFIYSALEFKASKIAAIAGNHAVPIINKSLFSSVLVGFPSFKEQEKIAKCLSTLDELIMEQAAKIEAQNIHKIGLLQGFFPKSI